MSSRSVLMLFFRIRNTHRIYSMSRLMKWAWFQVGGDQRPDSPRIIGGGNVRGGFTAAPVSRKECLAELVGVH